MESVVVFNVGGAGGLRSEVLDGREYLVAPTNILAEGVWPGTKGNVYYPPEELEDSVENWNHKPIVVYHPKDAEGNAVNTAARPDVLEHRGIGFLLNTDYGDKLTTESWVDVEKANRVDARVVKKLRAGQPVEVSTGLKGRAYKKKGEFDGKEYEYELRNFKPNHLAALPDKLGAYSVADGGGMLVCNSREEPEGVASVLSRSASGRLKAIGAEVVGNELSFGQTQRQLCELLAAKFGEPGKYWSGSVHEVYKTYVVFCQPTDSYGQFWVMDYSAKDDSVSLKGKATQVERVVEYRSADGSSYAVNNSAGELVHNSREGVMSDFNKKAHVDALIASGDWFETDRDWLSGMEDVRLSRIPVNKKVENGKKEEEKVGVFVGKDSLDKLEKPILKVDNEKPAPKVPLTEKEVMEALSPATRAMFKRGVEAVTAQKKAYIDVIVANARNKFTKEFLETQEPEFLEGLAGLASVDNEAGVPMFHFGGGIPARINNAADKLPEPLPQPTYAD